MAQHEQYILRVTAGATYDASTHEHVLVNSEKPVRIQSDLIDATVHMRIKDYRGLFSLLLAPARLPHALSSTLCYSHLANSQPPKRSTDEA